MMADEDEGGSPPCFACEMDEAYAGFLPPDELAAALAHLIRLADLAPDRPRKQWRAVLEPALARLPPPTDSGQRHAGERDRDLVGVARRLLPRIADDRLHAAIKALLPP